MKLPYSNKSESINQSMALAGFVNFKFFYIKSHNGSWYFGSVVGFVFVTNRQNMHDACLSKLDRSTDKSSFFFC